MRIGLTLLLLFFSLAPARAEICDEGAALIEREFEADFSSGFLEHIELPIIHYGVESHQNIYLHLGTDGSPNLYGVYDWKTTTLGTFYTLYRLEILIGSGVDRQSIEQDYTNSCTATPPQLERGRRLELLPIKVLPRADGSPRAQEHVVVRVWAR